MPGTTTGLRQDTFLTELLARHAVRTPDKPAVIHPDGDRMESAGRPAYASVGYAEFAARVTACAAALEEHGIRRGTRTALLVTPGVDLLTLVFALLHVGAVPVVVDPGMGLNRMLDCLHRVGVQAFIGVPAAHILRRLRPRAFAGVRSLIKVGGGSGTALEELTALGAGLPQLPPLKSGPDDLALIGYTTGSTGPAKPVELTVGMLRGMAYGVEKGHFTADMTSTLVTLPLMGVFDLAAGRTAVVPKMNMGRVGAADPALLTDAIQRFSVNAMFASPALLGPLSAHLAATGAHVPSLHMIVSGGAPVSPELMGALRAVLPGEARVFSTYGATEALPIALVESREALAGRPPARLRAWVSVSAGPHPAQRCAPSRSATGRSPDGPANCRWQPVRWAKSWSAVRRSARATSKRPRPTPNTRSRTASVVGIAPVMSGGSTVREGSGSAGARATGSAPPTATCTRCAARASSTPTRR